MDIDYHKIITEEFIRENKDEINWEEICICQKLSEDFIREFHNKVNWEEISCCQKLNENFIREFQDKVYWNYISTFQKLSEEFIREFKDEVDWTRISGCQKLSEKFIREFKNKVNLIYFLNQINFKVSFDKNKNIYRIISNNYCSNYLEFNEFIDLAIRLISLKAFK